MGILGSEKVVEEKDTLSQSCTVNDPNENVNYVRVSKAYDIIHSAWAAEGRNECVTSHDSQMCGKTCLYY